MRIFALLLQALGSKCVSVPDERNITVVTVERNILSTKLVPTIIGVLSLSLIVVLIFFCRKWMLRIYCKRRVLQYEYMLTSSGDGFPLARLLGAEESTGGRRYVSKVLEAEDVCELESFVKMKVTRHQLNAVHCAVVCNAEPEVVRSMLKVHPNSAAAKTSSGKDAVELAVSSAASVELVAELVE